MSYLSSTRVLPVLALVPILCTHPGCDRSPTEPIASPTPSPTVTPQPACAQLAGAYQRSLASSTCMAERVSGGPLVTQVAECTFRAIEPLLGVEVTLISTGPSSGTISWAWPACNSVATGTFAYQGGNVDARFEESFSNSTCTCGSLTGSFVVSGSFLWAGQH